MISKNIRMNLNAKPSSIEDWVKFAIAEKAIRRTTWLDKNPILIAYSPSINPAIAPREEERTLGVLSEASLSPSTINSASSSCAITDIFAASGMMNSKDGGIMDGCVMHKYHRGVNTSVSRNVI